MDRYGTVDDVIEPLEDGMYYRVDDADAKIADLEAVIAASFAQTDELIELIHSHFAEE